MWMTLWATISGWVCTSAHLTYCVLEVQETRVVVHHGGDWRGHRHRHCCVRGRCWLPSSWWTVRADWDLESFWSVVITNHHNTSKSCEVPVERATLSLTFIDTHCYFPYLCAEYPYISTDSFLSIQGHFSPQCFAPDTEVRLLVTSFIYLVLTYYLVCLWARLVNTHSVLHQTLSLPLS